MPSIESDDAISEESAKVVKKLREKGLIVSVEEVMRCFHAYIASGVKNTSFLPIFVQKDIEEGLNNPPQLVPVPISKTES